MIQPGFSILLRNGMTACAIALILASASPILAATSTKPQRVGHVVAQAFADRQAIRPGDTVHLVVSLRMDKDWHVYWRNPGPTGLPTKIRWTAPQGYKVGRTEFPVPELKYDKVLKEDAYVHEGAALFLTPVQVPASISPGGSVTFKASVSWLACLKNCIPGNCEMTLTLPVVSQPTKTTPANEKLFEEARSALPTPGAQAEHIKLIGSTDAEAITPGKKFTATLTVQVAPKHHMQSHKPFQDYLIPATLFVEPTDGFEIGEVEYPKGHERTDKILGKLSEYQGATAFIIPIEVDEDADTAGRLIRGILQYQICTDSGTCFPPQYVTFQVPVGTPAAKASAPPQATTAFGTSETAGGESENVPSALPNATGLAPSAGYGSRLIRLQNWFLSYGYAGVLVLALIGGVILNLMPCVLPVISLKILSFVRQADENRRRIIVLGVAYCTGILVFFGFIAMLFFYNGTGWGELFQRPRVVLGLAAVVTAFSLSLFGVFAVFTPKVINKLGAKAEGEGVSSAFFTGVLATVLGTACTAPFLSAAVGAASRFSPGQGAVIFLAVGVGMALPFLILAANPTWLRFIPKPGPWMGTFEAMMGFLLLGTVVWLLNPLRGQLGDFGLLLALVFLLAVALAVWVKGGIAFADPMGRKAMLNSLAIFILLVGWMLPFRWMATIDELIAARIQQNELIALGEESQDSETGDSSVHPGRLNFTWPDEGIPWKHYRRSRVREFVRQGFTVFVDYTADWCVNCKVNLKTSIDVPQVTSLMKQLNVVPFEADYTLKVPEIQQDLKRFGRAGVPMYLVYSPGDPDNPQVLPEILTPQSVIEALKKAGASRLEALATSPASPTVRD
jgi:thiol:disulfide interchange protein DsbD